MRNRILALSMAGALLGPLALLPGTAEAQQRGYARNTAAVTVQVPTIVKLVVDDQVRTPDGAPVVRVVSNDPSIRAAAANGVTPEILQVAGVRSEITPRGKGGEAAEQGSAASRIIRYTITQP